MSFGSSRDQSHSFFAAALFAAFSVIANFAAAQSSDEAGSRGVVSLEGTWVDQNGLEVQIIQSSTDIIGYTTQNQREVFRGVISGSSVKGGVLAEMDQGRVRDACVDWASEWLPGLWEIHIDRYNTELVGDYQPLYVTLNPTTLTCSSEPRPRVRSVFRKQRSTYQYCLMQEHQGQWEKSLREAVLDFYSNFEPHPFGPHIPAWNENVWSPDTLTLDPVPPPDFTTNMPQIYDAHLDRAEWALSTAFVGRSHGFAISASSVVFDWEDQLWYRMPSSDGGKGVWERYNICSYGDIVPSELAACASAKPDEVGQELIETVATGGMVPVAKVGVTVTGTAIMWVGRRVGRRAAATGSSVIIETGVKEAIDDFGEAACIEIAETASNAVSRPPLDPETMLRLVLNERGFVSDAPTDGAIRRLNREISRLTSEEGIDTSTVAGRRALAERLEQIPGLRLGNRYDTRHLARPGFVEDLAVAEALDNVILDRGLNWATNAGRAEAAEVLARDFPDVFRRAGFPDSSRLQQIRRDWGRLGTGQGTQTFAFGQLIDNSGSVFQAQFGRYVGQSQTHVSMLTANSAVKVSRNAHAEEQIVAFLRNRLLMLTEGQRERIIYGGRLQVVVDQLPCVPNSSITPRSHGCGLALVNFAREHRLTLDVFAPVYDAARGRIVSPKTAARSYTRFGIGDRGIVAGNVNMSNPRAPSMTNP